MREACIPAANGYMTAKALAITYDSFLESLGLSDGRTRRSSAGTGAGGGGGGGGARVAGVNGREGPLLSRARVNEMRSYQVRGSINFLRCVRCICVRCGLYGGGQSCSRSRATPSWASDSRNQAVSVTEVFS